MTHEATRINLTDVITLQRLLRRVLGGAPIAVCEHFHHDPVDRHGDGEDCPVEARWNRLDAEIRAALGR